MASFISLALYAPLLIFSAPSVSYQSSTITGQMMVDKGNSPLACVATLELDGATFESSTQVLDFAVSGGQLSLCTLISFENVPYDIAHDGGEFTISDVYVNSLWTPGGCEGDITGSVSDGVVTIDAILPEVTANTGDCILQGLLS